MAKRRKKRSAPRRRTAFKSVRRRAKKATGLNNLIQPDAMLYGGLRAKVSNAISPVTSKIPLGDVADEVGMGLLTWFVAKKTSGMLKNVALKGLVIENARIGEALASGSIFGSLGSSKPASGNSFR